MTWWESQNLEGEPGSGGRMDESGICPMALTMGSIAVGWLVIVIVDEGIKCL